MSYTHRRKVEVPKVSQEPAGVSFVCDAATSLRKSSGVTGCANFSVAAASLHKSHFCFFCFSPWLHTLFFLWRKSFPRGRRSFFFWSNNPSPWPRTLFGCSRNFPRGRRGFSCLKAFAVATGSFFCCLRAHSLAAAACCFA